MLNQMCFNWFLCNIILIVWNVYSTSQAHRRHFDLYLQMDLPHVDDDMAITTKPVHNWSPILNEIY